MRTLGICFVAAASLLVVSTMLGQGAATAKIGVVDLKKVSEEWKKWKDYTMELMAYEENVAKVVQADVEKLQKGIRALETKLRRHEVGKEWFDLQEDLERKKLEIRMAQQRGTWSVQVEAERKSKRLIAQIESVIEEYAGRNGFAMVLQQQFMPIEKLSWTELRGYYARKVVLHYSSGMDISDDIIRILNKKYEEEKKAAGGGGKSGGEKEKEEK